MSPQDSATRCSRKSRVSMSSPTGLSTMTGVACLKDDVHPIRTLSSMMGSAGPAGGASTLMCRLSGDGAVKVGSRIDERGHPRLIRVRNKEKTGKAGQFETSEDGEDRASFS